MQEQRQELLQVLIIELGFGLLILLLLFQDLDVVDAPYFHSEIGVPFLLLQSQLTFHRRDLLICCTELIKENHHIVILQVKNHHLIRM